MKTFPEELQPLEYPEEYGWAPANAEARVVVPADLLPYYRCFRPDGFFGYVCPCCRYVWPPNRGENGAGIFRSHLKHYLGGTGCFFNPKQIQETRRK